MKNSTPHIFSRTLNSIDIEYLSLEAILNYTSFSRKWRVKFVKGTNNNSEENVIYSILLNVKTNINHRNGYNRLTDKPATAYQQRKLGKIIMLVV